MTFKLKLLFFAPFLLLSGCTVGPDYKAPVIETPAQWTIPMEQASEYASLEWWKGMEDPQLNWLIETTLSDNLNLQSVLLKVIQAQANLQIARGNIFPQLDLSGNTSRQSTYKNAAGIVDPGDGSSPNPLTNSSFTITGGVSYEIDFWGKAQRQNEEALAYLMAEQEGAKSLVISLVSQVAQSYITLLALDHQLKITKEVVANLMQQQKMIQDRFRFGLASDLDLKQAESQTVIASQQIPVLEKKIVQNENALSALMGRNPESVPRGKSFPNLKKIPWQVPFLPSDLLKRRPDIRQAEKILQAKNAAIGIAKSEYFPNVNLSASLGFVSPFLKDLFQKNSLSEQHGANFGMPIFTAGKIRGNIKKAKSMYESALGDYRQVIQMAVHEVEDALISCKKTDEQENRYLENIKILSKTVALARVRYQEGLTNYLDVVTAEKQLNSQRFALVDVQKEAFLSRISLYKALAGGWEGTSEKSLENEVVKAPKL